MSGNGQVSHNAIETALKAEAQAATYDPKIMNLVMIFKGMIERGEVAGIAMTAIRHDGLPASGYMAAETIPAKMLVHSSLMILAGQVEAHIMQAAMQSNRPSPILKPGRPPGM